MKGTSKIALQSDQVLTKFKTIDGHATPKCIQKAIVYIEQYNN